MQGCVAKIQHGPAESLCNSDFFFFFLLRFWSWFWLLHHNEEAAPHHWTFHRLLSSRLWHWICMVFQECYLNAALLYYTLSLVLQEIFTWSLGHISASCSDREVTQKNTGKEQKKNKKKPVLTVLILDKQSACRLPSRQKGPNSLLCVPLHKSLFLKNKQRFSSSARLLFQLKALVSSHGDTCGTSLKHISNKLHETKITSWPDQKQIPDLYMTPAYLPFIHMQTHLWKKITSNILTNTF